MKVSVFGLGYVGAVTLACLSRDGIGVIGVDLSADKVALLNAGKAPIIELGLSELLQAGAESGRLRATTSAKEAVIETDMTLVSVGTPSQPSGALMLSAVHKVCEEIGAAVKAKGRSHVVVIRSTVLPGTTERCGEILREHAGDIPVHVAFNPEFLREGTAIRDYDQPPYTIIGTNDPAAEHALREMYATVQAPVIVVDSSAAEMLKLTANAWHATKIAFANEIGRVAKSVGVDGRVVMDIITQDNKLNISSAYMRPGFAYGGSCLPKDVRALTYFAKVENIDLPLLSSLPPSNIAQVELAVERVLMTKKRRVGLLGLAFKAGTDDLRESPAVALAERLMGKGCDLRILDNAVRQSKLIGANLSYIENHIPHLSSLLVSSAAELLEHAEVVVVTHGAAEFREIIAQINPTTPIIDLAGIMRISPEGKTYEGIAW
jgi:GDP-mannose 6-dehydrogenase